jgi:hypothetical protein
MSGKKLKTPAPFGHAVACAALVLALCASLVPAHGQAGGSPAQIRLSDYLKVYVGVIDPRIVQDVFGKRVAQRFVAIQVTIANQNKDYQFLIHDVSLDLKQVFGREFSNSLRVDSQKQCDVCKAGCMERSAPIGSETPEEKDGRIADCEDECANSCRPDKFELSSLELSLIRGVAEKGQGEDSRNKVLRYFRAFGSIAAGFIGVASFGPSYPKAVAIFNGPVISAYSELYPDYTINQMNRLNDSAYKSNTLVPRQQAKVIVAFIPQAIFLNKEQRKKFWDDPTTLYPDYASGRTTGTVDFRKAQALVDGSFIVEVENLPPQVTGINITPEEALNFLGARPVVKGYVLGKFLEGAEIDLTNAPEGMDVALDGEPKENKLFFTITSDRPVPRGTTLNFHVFNAAGSQNFAKQVSYTPPVPTLEAAEPDAGAPGTAELEVTLAGNNFVAGVTKVSAPEGSGVEVLSEPEVESATSLKVKLKIASGVAPGTVVKLKVLNGTTQSNEVDFTVR